MSKRIVNKQLYKNYLKKAEDMLGMAKLALEGSKYNAAVVSSIHCAINSLDALAVFYLGQRYSGGHEGALVLIKPALNPGEFEDLSKQYGGLIELKNRAEYQPELMGAREANDAVKRAERIFARTSEKLPS